MKKLILLLLLLLLSTGCRPVESVESIKEESRVNYILSEQNDFTVVKTRADNIKPETIRSPICSDYIRDLGYYGINAGFFNTIYRDEKPADEDFVSVSISWSKEDANKNLEVCGFSKRDWEKIALGESPYIARGVLVLYVNNDGQNEAVIITAESVDDVKMRTGEDFDYIYMIGGGNFYLGDYPKEQDWEKYKKEKYLEEGPLVMEDKKYGRTGVGIKKEDGVWYVYLVSSGTNGEESKKTLEELRALFISLGCSDAIYLDGAGSSQMRFAKDDGEIIEKSGDNRYIWSMVRLIKTND